MLCSEPLHFLYFVIFILSHYYLITLLFEVSSKVVCYRCFGKYSLKKKSIFVKIPRKTFMKECNLCVVTGPKSELLLNSHFIPDVLQGISQMFSEQLYLLCHLFLAFCSWSQFNGKLDLRFIPEFLHATLSFKFFFELPWQKFRSKFSIIRTSYKRFSRQIDFINFNQFFFTGEIYQKHTYEAVPKASYSPNFKSFGGNNCNKAFFSLQQTTLF